MDAYGFWAFFAGLVIGSLLWRLNDNIFGMIIYQLYCDFVGKLDRFLMMLDERVVYEEYRETYKSRVSYRTYCKSVESYRPILRKRQRRIMWHFLYYEAVKPVNLAVTLLSLFFFMFALHWLAIGFLAYIALRYGYHYLEIVRAREPYALINYLASDAVAYSKEKKTKP